ncbi:DNA binding protein [Fragilaria crotonensis]|nr:DNA binding protein [Fragilaria crotonensis]
MRRPAFNDESAETDSERALKERWRGINTSHMVTGPQQGTSDSERMPSSESARSRILDQEVASVLHYISRQPDPSQMRRSILAASLPVAASFTELFDSVPQEHPLPAWEMPDLDEGFFDISTDERAVFDAANDDLYSSTDFHGVINSPPTTESPCADTITNTEYTHTSPGYMHDSMHKFHMGNSSGDFDMATNNPLMTNWSRSDLSRDMQIISMFQSAINSYPITETPRANNLINATSDGFHMTQMADWSRADRYRDLQIINMLSRSLQEKQNDNSGHFREDGHMFVATTGKSTNAPAERPHNIKEIPQGVSVLDFLSSQLLPVKSADAETDLDEAPAVAENVVDRDRNFCDAPEFFPMTLHRLLMDVENDDKKKDIIKFILPLGRSFIVKNIQRFESEIMPLYFPRMKRFASFQRQLNLYNFSRVGGTGPSQTEYCHAKFIRDNPGLVKQMRRTKIKGLFKVPPEKRRYRRQQQNPQTPSQGHDPRAR